MAIPFFPPSLSLSPSIFLVQYGNGHSMVMAASRHVGVRATGPEGPEMARTSSPRVEAASSQH